MTERAKVLLIGIGNVDRQDDGVGQVIVRRAQEVHHDCDTMLVRQLLPEMVDVLVTCDLVIFVDAAADLLPGEVATRQLICGEHPGSSHLLSPKRFLELAAMTLPTVPEAWSLEIGVAQMDFGRELSAEVAAAIPQAVQQLVALIPSASAKPNHA